MTTKYGPVVGVQSHLDPGGYRMVVDRNTMDSSDMSPLPPSCDKIQHGHHVDGLSDNQNNSQTNGGNVYNTAVTISVADIRTIPDRSYIHGVHPNIATYRFAPSMPDDNQPRLGEVSWHRVQIEIVNMDELPQGQRAQLASTFHQPQQILWAIRASPRLVDIRTRKPTSNRSIQPAHVTIPPHTRAPTGLVPIAGAEHDGATRYRRHRSIYHGPRRPYLPRGLSPTSRRYTKDPTRDRSKDKYLVDKYLFS